MHQISAKTGPRVFLSKFKKPSHCIQLDFLTLITLSQLTNLINVSSRFQLEDLISGVNF